MLMFPFIRTLMFIYCFIPTLSMASQKLTLCFEMAEYLPYLDSLNAKKNTKGYLNELITQTGQSLGIEIILKRDSWGRCQRDVLAGSSHGLFAMVATPERVTQYAFPKNALSNPSRYLWKVEYPIFYNKNKPLDLADYPNQLSTGIGAPFGYVVHKILANRKLLTSNNYSVEEGLKLVAQGKLDGYVVETEIGKSVINKLGHIDRVSISEQSILTSFWFVAFSPQFYTENQALVERFWTTLNQHRLSFRAPS